MPSERRKARRVQSTHSPARSSRLLPFLLVGMAILLSLVFYFRLAPLNEERTLATASLADLQKRAAEEKSNPRVLFHLAQKQEQSGKKQEARDAYWQALQLSPDNEEGWRGWVRTTEETLGPEQARKVLELWLQSAPRNVTAYAMLASLHERIGNHQLAYDTAVKGTEFGPDNGELWQVMGSAAMLLGKLPEAETAFRRAAALASTNWRNHSGLSDALWRLSKRSDAIAAAREAVRLAPMEAAAHLLLGTELLQAAQSPQEVEEASAELLLASQNANNLPLPGRFQLALTLGDSYKRQSRWTEARDAYQQAEQLRPYDPIVPYNLMRVYRSLGDRVHAEQATARYKMLEGYNHEMNVLTSHLESVPNDDAARLKLARLYARCDQFDLAVQHYQALLSRTPQNGTARQELDTLLARIAPAQR